MKRSLEALVMWEMVAVIVGMAIAGLCGVASAESEQPAVQSASPVATLRGDASLRPGGGGPPSTFHVETLFSTDTPGAEPFTIQKAVVFLPDRAGTNGRLFPSCSARTIERFHGDVRRCPSGSKIGSGTVTARAIQLGVTATGHVTIFNSRRGKGVTFNIQTYLPAYINESIDATLVRLRGYGEKLTLVVPHSLQEIIPGVFVAVRRFDVTIGGSVRVRGVEHGFIKARSCPDRRLRGVLDFKDWTSGRTVTVTAGTKVRCTVR